MLILFNLLFLKSINCAKKILCLILLGSQIVMEGLFNTLVILTHFFAGSLLSSLAGQIKGRESKWKKIILGLPANLQKKKL